MARISIKTASGRYRVKRPKIDAANVVEKLGGTIKGRKSRVVAADQLPAEFAKRGLAPLQDAKVPEILEMPSAAFQPLVELAWLASMRSARLRAHTAKNVGKKSALVCNKQKGAYGKKSSRPEKQKEDH